MAIIPTATLTTTIIYFRKLMKTKMFERQKRVQHHSANYTGRFADRSTRNTLNLL